MCGICGVIGNETQSAERAVRKMMDALIHRGPDGEGILTRPGAVLGSRRLGIIDLAGGHQPIFNEAGDVAVVFNGEIYNFRQLRHELERCSHGFHTFSDTEVIVHAYEEWGGRCVEHLRGMFAFAIWDGRKVSDTPAKLGRVFLARDRLGIKPLYYSMAGGALFFASEVRALLASGAIERRLSRQAIEGYLLFGSVIEPTTVVEGIYSLPPGHTLTLELGNAISPSPRRYWDVSAEAGDAREDQRTPGLAGSPLPALLQTVVDDHLFADVPSGIFLSGGLDSSALLALAARQHGNMQTFTVSFGEREFDEGSLARETAKHFGACHHELVLSDQLMKARLFDAVRALDQPTMDGVNTYFVSMGAHQVGLKMALSGLGGDELFAGYPVFRTAPALERIRAFARRLPRQLRKKIARGLLAVGRHSGSAAGADRLRKIAAIFNDPAKLPHSYFFARMLFTPAQIDMLLPASRPSADNQTMLAEQPGWMDALADLTRRAESFQGDSVVRYFELRHYMLNTLLRDTDAVSMHHSLEVRVPLLDDRIVRFAQSLPEDSQSRSHSPKPLLAQAVKDLLPAEVLRRPKRPFTLPWQRWFRAELGIELGRQLSALTPSLESIMNKSAVAAVWSDFLRDRTGWARPWSLVVLNEWVRAHMDNAPCGGETDSYSAAPVTAKSQQTNPLRERFL